MKRSALVVLSAAVSASACAPADEVEVQPLPSLEQSSLEARAGLPSIAGAWRFAGWELAEDDSASLERELPRFGVISLETQKRDSLAGVYVIQAGRAPLYGEVRRDSVVALVGVFGPGDLRFLSGRVSRDTVWMELSSLTEPGNWPSDARAAFVKTAVDSPFVRLRGALPPPPPAVAAIDTMPATPGALPPEGAAVTTPGTPGIATPPAAPPSASGRPPATTVPPAGGRAPVTAPPSGARAPVTAPPPAPAPRRETPRPPAPPPPPPPAPEPEPEPPIPLLGDPSVPDTTGGL